MAVPTATPVTGSKKPAARGGRRKLTFDRASFFVVFLGLPLTIYVLFVIWPFIQAVYISLTSWNGFDNSMPFVGLDNYVTLFNDDVFRRAMLNSAILAVVLPLATITMSLVLAILVTVGGPTRGRVRGVRGAGFYRVVSFFPYVIPAIVVGIMWGQMFDPNRGLVNGVLKSVGIPIGSYAWLGDARTALPTAIFIIMWGFVGFYMVLFIASIKGIPSEMYDAARVDGAGRLRTAWSVTIPMIRDNVETAYIYMGIIALDAFVYMSALYLSPGGPENSTLVMSQQLYYTAFGGQGKFGLAAAMGVILAMMTLIFAALVFGFTRLTRGRSSDERL